MYDLASHSGMEVSKFHVETVNIQHKKPSWKNVPDLDQSIRRWAEPCRYCSVMEGFLFVLLLG